LFVVLLGIAPASQELEPPTNPGRFVAAAQTSGSDSGASAFSVTAPTFNFGAEPARREIQQQVTTTPSMGAPNVFSSNPCVVSASGAFSALGFGMALGAGVEDRECTRRAHAALLAQMGLPRAAAEVLCHNSEVRAAMAVSAVPCAADRPANTVMPDPPAVQGGNGARLVAPAAPQGAAPAAPQAAAPAPRQAAAPVGPASVPRQATAPIDASGMPVVAAPVRAPTLAHIRPD
jgi:hypothetical protein